MKPEINIEEFSKIEVRVGTITSAEKVEGSTKLIKLIVDFGELGIKQVLTGMQEYYEPEIFVGKQTCFVVNLQPRKMMGLESQGMIFAVDADKPVFLNPEEKVENGSSVI